MFFPRAILLLCICLSALLTGCATDRTTVYTVEEKGRSTLSAALDKKMPTSAEQWTFARAAQQAGDLKKADSRMLYLVRRWPNSLEAPWAQRARADMFFARGKIKKAFEEYQYLIDNYAGRMRDYDTVLENQFQIATKIMNNRRMPWLFGGYRTPEAAVDYFEAVIRNGPQWERAPEAQFLIGRCQQKAGETELAITAYGVLGYRYPESRFAEEGAWRQIQCLDKLRRQYPENVELLNRTITATTVFKETYPQSKYTGSVNELRNTLYEVKAGKIFDVAAFYAKVPRNAEAAIVYYEQLIEEFPKSERVPEARRRIDEIRGRMVRSKAPSVPAGPTLPQEPVEEERGDAME